MEHNSLIVLELPVLSTVVSRQFKKSPKLLCMGFCGPCEIKIESFFFFCPDLKKELLWHAFQR